MTGGTLRRWVAASIAFHVLLVWAVWRVRVPVLQNAAPALAVYILPALVDRPAGATPVPEPALNPRPVPRPFLRPPPMALDAAALLPGPFPIEDAWVRAALDQPVLPPPAAPEIALRGADPLPLLRREPPAPLLD